MVVVEKLDHFVHDRYACCACHSAVGMKPSLCRHVGSHNSLWALEPVTRKQQSNGPCICHGKVVVGVCRA